MDAGAEMTTVGEVTASGALTFKRTPLTVAQVLQKVTLLIVQAARRPMLALCLTTRGLPTDKQLE